MTEKENDIMQENTVDEELLDAFFAPSQQMQVSDDGFSDSVMSRLPEAVPFYHSLGYALWTLVCTLACFIIFFVNDGFALLKQILVNSLGSVVTTLSQMVTKVDVSALLPVALPENAFFVVPLVVVGALTIVSVVSLYGVMQTE
jgi:hypothetical protein